MIWHRLRGHAIAPYRVVVSFGSPWRWSCSCGKTWGGRS